MPAVSPDGYRHLNCYQVSTQRAAYGMLCHSTVHFRDQHMV